MWMKRSSKKISKSKNAPVVRLIDSIISQAIKTRTSDIHIEPFEKVVRVRFRVDGTLVENTHLNYKYQDLSQNLF